MRQSAADGHVVAATYLTRAGTAAGADRVPLDVRDRTAAVDLIGAFSPVGAAHVALATSGNGGRLVHVSSDVVFSGKETTYADDRVPERDGIDPARLPYGRRADTDLPGPLDVRLDCGLTQRHLRTRLRGAREFLR
ncbi:hypothetical protein IL992_44655 [Microbispora sp. NEAU-D428]|uniref:hypothetical protein n=1 Tax=Microbispora sitophila TaxID=2771537 RepID=UPI0018688EB6|nr:hypothetical protein [Microbispora sitophila]MBE3016191.1 hypothetical protein [Microbispora sitophila]